MSDLINRQAAIDVARDWYEGLICGSFKGLEKRLRALPPAEPEIIRCKDCEHCADDWNGNQPMFTCELGSCGESVMPNDFCSKAERREE